MAAQAEFLPPSSSNSQPALPPREKRKRKRELIAIAVVGVVLFILTLAEFRLGKISSTLPFVNSIFFFGLLNINIILLIALIWLVFRNVGKLFIERRSKILGARLRTKLVLVFFGFSIIPTLVLFVISALYINSSFDKWFSIKIQNTFQASLDITSTFYKNADLNAMHFAEHLSRQISRRLPGEGSLESLGPWLESQRELLALDGVEFYVDPFDERVVAQRAPVPELQINYPRLPLDILDKAFVGEKTSVIEHIGSGDLIRCLVPVKLGAAQRVAGVLVVNTYIPVSLVNKVDEIANVLDDYKGTNPLKYPMKTMYFVILVMITLVILIVAIWIGLYMARELTDPVERLVHGAQAVGAGNLDVLVQSTGHDEIAVLVESFNRMTRDLRENRAHLNQASADLEKRRQQLEAVLANVGTGVIVVDRDGGITTFNHALSQLLGVSSERALGRDYREVLLGEAAPLAQILNRALDAQGGLSEHAHGEAGVEQWNHRIEETMRTLSAIGTSLRDSDGSAPWGAVVVVDDMTYLIKGQREMAWREVARRIAHEIKNPLTPIKLSAQRLQRRLGSMGGRDGDLLQECTDTIIKHTDELKEMVNEFSNFARFPEANPAPHDLNEALREVVALYGQGHPDIRIPFEPESQLPVFEFDRDQVKRVLINLLDNAVSALHQQPVNGKVPSIRVQTHYNQSLQLAVISIQDNGPGMTEEVRARVFEPYFSTKAEGTGLGLAIAKRIINDHDGFIRVQSAPGEGTQFSIELPTRTRNATALRSPQ